jgi:hypothetical protein
VLAGELAEHFPKIGIGFDGVPHPNAVTPSAVLTNHRIVIA